jgi:hypothetical protein
MPEQLVDRIQSAAGKGRQSIDEFALRAIEMELDRLATGREAYGDVVVLEEIGSRMQKLEAGQRAIVALLDSSARLLASLLRGRNICG